MTKYTDGNYVYYVSGLLGDNQYAVCKKPNLKKTFGNHKYKSNANKVVNTADEAQEYLDRIADKHGWIPYIYEDEEV